jgi:hypothetical protein
MPVKRPRLTEPDVEIITKALRWYVKSLGLTRQRREAEELLDRFVEAQRQNKLIISAAIGAEK